MTAGDGGGDTSTAARDAQLDLLRQLTPTERLRMADDLDRDVEALARTGIRRDHPDAPERVVLWHLASRRYGVDLADAVYGPLAPG